MGTGVDRIELTNSDTDGAVYDTGAFASAGTTVAGKALHGAALVLRRILLDTAAALTGMRAGDCTLERDGVRAGGSLLGFPELIAAAPADHRRGDGLAADGSEFGEMRSLAFNVHAFRVAIDIRTGEVRILQSIQSADAGTVMNPEQCRGQVEGGVAQAIGTSLYEEVMIGPDGDRCQPGLPHLPGTADGRHPHHRGLLRQHQRRPGPVRGEIDERKPLQPRRAGPG